MTSPQGFDGAVRGAVAVAGKAADLAAAIGEDGKAALLVSNAKVTVISPDMHDECAWI